MAWAASGVAPSRAMASTLAPFHRRAARAVSASLQSAARMPGTLLAAMLTPVPVQQKTTPASAAPWATSRATCSATSGQGVAVASTAPQRITAKPASSRLAAMASAT